MSDTCDLFIIGGGINGVGIARDAAGRGLKVILVEKNDLASATSSNSSKLIHGGLRYLEHYEFGLVRESLQERERLWKIAPHLIRPLRFLLPFHKELRPAFILRIGLFIYDYIGGRKLLPASKSVKFTGSPLGTPLHEGFVKGFEYSDCWVDDARLVVLNAISAFEQSAQILTRHTFTSAKREGNHWKISVIGPDGKEGQIIAKAIVNAAGPWVTEALDACARAKPSTSKTKLVKGSHIIVPKLYNHDRAYTFQSGDNRIIFAIPYENNYTLIGTTDTPYKTDPSKAEADSTEVDYLCMLASTYFKQDIIPSDVVWSYSGVRPLYDDGTSEASQATRDYVLEIDTQDGSLPILSVFGGKITTYRRLAEDALAKLAPIMGFRKKGWTGTVSLPGGDLGHWQDPTRAFDDFKAELRLKAPWLPNHVHDRLARSYGTRVFDLLGGVTNLKDMGQDFGAGLYAREIEFLKTHEWAITAEDILWRRSKLGLHMSEAERQAVKDYVGCYSETNE